MSSSYVWLRMEKSFWHDTGRGHPSLTHVVHSMVMPKPFSLETPQCLMSFASKSSLMDFTVRRG